MDENTQKLMNLLGLAMRAGKIITGESMVQQALVNGKLALVYVAQDTGASTKKKFKDKTEFYHVPIHDELTTEQITQAIGRPRKILGITDKGFAKGMVKLM
ncbi:L7Ae/L30e/S12e/Gadd45 family ribosomal protein [Agrilactobacillus fermenti]|uniref:L7Ae/L30e/S12e/Gadd45 family ribosomal protein n=1 Tax=Agrilactobacillus fermenti TaxID=2586909 RepID=UPI001E33505F|nr:ribosomal L7Ae/L30e/S12e/Gadd45 family protein [Agrilactobacillus fermenti]MCD2256261.1 ribosomal L7Ae/L30e/S12e/Gadd45 family protein [Agrilactobacillus fermenti]